MKFHTFSKNLVLILIFWFSISAVSAQVTQKIGDNPYTIDSKAVLELESTTKGFLLPRMTAAQMNLITTPSEGMMVYCTDCGTGLDGELRIAYNSIWQSFKGNLTGDITGNAATVTTNANLTGEVTSVGNATTIAPSPALTGTPSAPTATAGTNTTQIATTAFVTAAASSSNFVDLTTNQTIAGVKTFRSDVIVNSVKIGRGTGNNPENTAVGNAALGTGIGSRNSAFGNGALRSYSGTDFDNNTSVGFNNLSGLTTGKANTSVGAESMTKLTTGISNTSIGNHSLMNTTGNNNVGVGQDSGNIITTGSNNTIIGTAANVSATGQSNSTAIGFQAVAASSNTIQLGNTAITNVNTSGTLTAGAVTYTSTDGTTGQILTTDGSGNTSWVAADAGIREMADEFTSTGTGDTSPASSESFTLFQTPSANSKVKMYVNGVRISNSAYTLSGSTLTYDPTKNGDYGLKAGDRIQIDYYW